MTDFLLLLGKLNLAMGAAIGLVWLLRRPLRAQFGAPNAYALWLLVPVVGLACLLPPRVAAPLPVHLVAVQIPAAPMIAQIARPAPQVTEPMTAQNTPIPSPSVQPVIAAPATDYAMPDYATLLFAAWLLGVGAMTFYLARLQARFHAAAKLGEAGPAVAGFFRPRIVIPGGFGEQFSLGEQAAILAHERAHLARQDARINALAALLRCLCWFNPLMHLGAFWLRIDQELACDAAAMRGRVSRRDYANALLKSQMTLTPLPLGCDWPGSEHPLTERIVLLKRKRPGPGRRIAGEGLVLFAAAFAGFGAWAAQPTVPGKAVAAPHNQVALASAPRISIASDQNRQSAVPATEANPVPSGNPADAAKSVPVTKAVAAAPNSDSAQAQPVLPMSEAPEQKIDLALNDAADAALAKAATDASGSLSDEAVAQKLAATVQPAMPASSAAPAQIAAAASVSNSVAVMDVLSRGACVPTVGTVISVHGDATAFGTDIVLDHVSASPQAKPSMRDNGIIIARIPADNVKSFSALETYVGHKVAIWPIIGDIGNKTVLPIVMPSQLQLLSTALADPKKTWCYLTPIQREYPESHAAADAAVNSVSATTSSQPAAAIALTDQPVGPMQPATPDPSAGPVRVAAAMPAAKQISAGMTPDEVVAWLQSAGYTAHAVLRTGDLPLYTAQAVLRTRDLPLTIDSYSSRGRMFGIYLRDCQEDHCRHLHFFSNMGLMNPHARGAITEKQVALWNQENPSTPATNRALSFDFQLPAARNDQINGALALWNDAVNRFYDFADLGTLAAPTAATVQVASANLDPLAGVGTLVNGKCQPLPRPRPDRQGIFNAMPSGSETNPDPVIGTLASVYIDAHFVGTDIELDHILPTPGVTALIRDGKIIAIAPVPPAFESHVGQQVAVWGMSPFGGGRIRATRVLPVCHPS